MSDESSWTSGYGYYGSNYTSSYGSDGADEQVADERYVLVLSCVGCLLHALSQELMLLVSQSFTTLMLGLFICITHQQYNFPSYPTPSCLPTCSSEFGAIRQVKDVMLILIDCGPKMRTVDEEGHSWLDHALHIVASTLKTRIVSAPTDMIGVAFFNSRAAKNEVNYEGLYVLFNPEEPRAELLKTIMDLQVPKEFESKIGFAPSDKPCEMFQALRCASSVFTQSLEERKVEVSKRLLILTANDDPCRGNEALRSKAVQYANDLKDLDVNISLLPLVPYDAHIDPETQQRVYVQESNDFNVEKFYMKIINLENEDGADDAISRMFSRREDLLEVMRQKTFKKRTLASTAMDLGAGGTIGVKVSGVLLRCSDVPMFRCCYVVLYNPIHRGVLS